MHVREVITVQPIAIAQRDFAATEEALFNCQHPPSLVHLPTIGDESSAYLLTFLDTDSHDRPTTLPIGVGIVRLANVRIAVLLYASNIKAHQLQFVMQTAVDRVVRTERLPPCAIGDLAFDYYGGQAAVGNDFGTIRLRDTSRHPCVLHGPVVVAGIDRAGRSVTQTVTYPVAPALVLTQPATRVETGHEAPPDEVVADLFLAAEYRDDPSGPAGLCTQHEVVPASWRLVLPEGVTTVANASEPIGQWSSLLTCRGQIDTPGPIGAEIQ